MATGACYILYAGITNTFNTYLSISLVLLVFETLVLIINKWTCPLTPIAEKYTTNRKDNFDIYLPNWLAKYNKTIFGIIFLAGLSLVLFNWLKNF